MANPVTGSTIGTIVYQLQVNKPIHDRGVVQERQGIFKSHFYSNSTDLDQLLCNPY
jgi:hypothetical protein